MKLSTESTVVNDGKLNTNIDNAQNTADEAKTIADNTAQNFWFKSTGTDTGAHITEVTQAEFEASPSGGNLLARSNGIAVRDGLTELATFSADGANINRNGASVAEFGATARIGTANSSRFLTNANSLQAYNASNTKYFEVSASGMTFGSNTVATTANVATAKSEAISTASSDATTKANNASKTATGYITAIDNNGIKVHATNNANSNYAKIDATGMDVYKGGTSVAFYGDTTRIGKETGAHTTIDEDGMQIYSIDSNDNLVELANIGYGEGQSASGTAIAPYYTFGTRASGSAIGNYSHAEGYHATASGFTSHAEGHTTQAIGSNSHAEGALTRATDLYSHAEGYSAEALAEASHAQNIGTIASVEAQTVIGRYNKKSSALYPTAFIIGNGTANNARSDALTVDWDGNVVASGTIEDGSGNRLDTVGTTTTVEKSSTSIANNGSTWQASSTTVTLTKGTWLLIGSATYTANATGKRGIRWYNTTSSAEVLCSPVQVPAVSGGVTLLQSIATVTLTATATLRIDLLQNCGNALSCTTACKCMKFHG